jgi:acetyl-CoA C-acetyltransferase
MREVRKVCIIDGSRIPFTRSGTHYKKLTNRDLMTTALKGLVQKLNLSGQELGEVALGAVNKHSYDFALARECVMDSGLSPHTPAIDLQKACGTSLEAALIIGNKIAMGQIECGIAGGVDTNSDVPMEFKKDFSDILVSLNNARTLGARLKAIAGIRPGHFIPNIPAIKEPRTGLSMGQSCELMAQEWKIPREDQDQLAVESHTKAHAAYEEGFYNDLIVECAGLTKDTILRPETTLERLGKLRPAFERSEKGTLTAGNSTAMTDGAACVFLCSEDYAKEQGYEVLAYLTYGQSAAVDYVNNEGLLMAPAYAVPKLLKQAGGIALQDFDFYEIHEAFAAQVLCTLKAWEDADFCKNKLGLEAPLGSIDRSKLNVKGGSLATGHPFAATGARIVTGLARILNQKGSGRGLISICTAGGMGVTAIIEK